jgi:RNA polymerase sigma-70 factor (ECF subfamily)
MLRSRKSRNEESLEAQAQETITARDVGPDPEQEALLADSVGLALLVVLETLTPSERLAFVLHDMFDVSFDEIATIVGRSPEAARQLASRARRRVRGTETIPDADLRRQREVVEAFLAALRAGDFEGLVAVLDPDVVVRVDASAAAPGAPTEIRGARTWAQGAVAFSQLARLVEPALVNGAPGLVFASGGRLSRALTFKITGEKVLEVDIITEPGRLSQLDVAVLDD